ncbi:MAG TPA: hypothetical protein VHM65_05320, partial [Candidatus Lustribacter sp.]|nr:hypothetical protein [Candidatus Lustribacter sp.]
VHSMAGLEAAVAEAKAAPAHGGPVVIHVETDPLVHAPGSMSWWDVPVTPVSALESTQTAYETYARYKATQRGYLAPSQRATPAPSTAPSTSSASTTKGL